MSQAAAISRGPSPAQLRLISIVSLLVIWEVAALLLQSRTLPDLWEVGTTFWVEMTEGSLLSDLGITLFRVLAAFLLAMVLGTAVGIAMGFNRRLDYLFDGWLIIFLNIPALVTIILCLIWFGINEISFIVAVALNKMPNVVVTVREGARAIDRDLLQVAEIFRVSRQRTFFRFFLPQLYPYLMAAGRSGVALIWKIVLVVELLGGSNGIGFQMANFFTMFDIAGLLAYTLAFVVVMLLVEMAIVEPLERRMTRWRK
ncbi:MAG: ABC transporter permease [Alphaproteobacteria bacterium]|nr:ABC transporter permease [Alphaproteobacteria bacterium]